VFFETEPRDGVAKNGGLPWDPFKAIVSPRPIGWLTSVSAAGVVNLAPYSYFTAVGDKPNVVMFSGGASAEGSRKDSQRNIEETGEFVCNLASWDLRDVMNATSAHYPADVDEAAEVGIELAASNLVVAPRVAAAPAALECVHLASYPAPRDRHGRQLTFGITFGQVVGVHVQDRFVTEEGRVDTVAMQPLARMGYDEFTVVDSSFRMSRPDFDLLDHLKT
jgi:flavin reductase (DIM6/NTAB) family NADH-FMN oxidoreductase RutF